MNNFYNLDEIKKQLTKELDRARMIEDLWANVTFPTKQNGEPFAKLSKNISGATISPKLSAMQFGENILCVSGNGKTGYVEDAIDVYDFVDNIDRSKAAKTQNYLPKSPYFRQVYSYDLDDIQEAIRIHCTICFSLVSSLEKQLKNVEQAYNAFDTAYTKIIDNLANSCDGADTYAFCAIKDTVFFNH